MGKRLFPDLVEVFREGFQGEFIAAGPAAQLNAPSGRLYN
jgi:hypothetical protein